MISLQKSTKKLDEHVTQSISNGTPIQSKKRPKRLESMDEGGEPADETANSTSSSLHTSRASHRKNSTQVAKGREKVRSLADEMAAVAPASLVPSVQSVVEEHSSKSHQEENERRPARAARVKATQNLKEPSLMGKLRQPSITIKKERISEELRNEQQVRDYMQFEKMFLLDSNNRASLSHVLENTLFFKISLIFLLFFFFCHMPRISSKNLLFCCS